MKKLLCIIIVLLLTLTASAECPQLAVEAYPVVDGSTATLPLSYALMAASTGISAEEAETSIVHTKTTESFGKLISGAADLLLVYEPAQSAYDSAKDANVELEIAQIGMDALVFLINEQNPVESLSREQLVGIYTDKITNWSEVGGADLPILAYQRDAASGSQVMMEAQVMQGTAMAEAPVSHVVGLMNELVDVIASYRNTSDSIGYSVYYYVKNMYMQEGIKLLKVDEVAPTNEAIASGEYPFTQAFYAIIRADEPEDSPARLLFNWLQTVDGAQLIEQAGYVPMG